MRPAVLVVEDDTATRTLLTVLIQRCGYDVDVVGDGNDAITLLSSTPYSAVVTDLYLPGRSGAEVLKFVRDKKPELLARSIMVSAAPGPEIESIRKEFSIEILRKPFDLAELIRIVNAAVGHAVAVERDLPSEFCRQSILSGAKAGAVFTPHGRDRFEVPISFGYPKGAITRYMPISIDAPLPVCEAYREKHGIWLQSPNAVTKYPALSDTWRENQSFALAALPLVTEGKVIGAAGWSFRTPRTFSPEERSRFEKIAEFVSKKLSSAA